MKKITVSAIMFVSVMTAAVAVMSQDDPAGNSPCRDDVKTYCKGIRAGGGRIWSCLKSHENELSQGCRDHMAEMREKGKDFAKACNEDRKKFCKKIPAGKGRIASCLKSHESELSEACGAYFKKN